MRVMVTRKSQGSMVHARGQSRSPVLSREAAAARRGGSALLMVVTILGILFVTGLALLTTVSFESRMLGLELRSKEDEIGVSRVTDEVSETLRNALVQTPGVPVGARPMGKMDYVADPDGSSNGWSAFVPDGLTSVELPLVHGFFSQIEPTARQTASGEWRMVYDWFTDLKTIRQTAQGGSLPAGAIYQNERRIDTALANFEVINSASAIAPYLLPDGDPDDTLPPTRVVDADGDGIVDAILAYLDEIGIPPSEAAALARKVSIPSYPSDRAQMGLRIIPHGGMVNLAEGHPALIENIMGDYRHFSSRRSSAYSPMLEERYLRHRGGVLPPRLLPPTALQGNPYLNPNEPDLTHGGDFESFLFPPEESVLPNGHRFWPFSPANVNGDDYLIWLARMDAGSDAYDLRHLVTTVSHDNLLARPTHVQVGAEDWNAFDLLMKTNKSASMGACPAELPFEYPNYPHNIQNGPANYDWCTCYQEQTAGRPCPFDLRKGRLKLSLAWLDEWYRTLGDSDGDPATIGDRQRKRLIQDAFTLLLFNARGSEWGVFAAAVPPSALSQPGGEGGGANESEHVEGDVWTQNADQFTLISRTAASLTANLLDFADSDNVPTDVKLRNADFNSATFGAEVNEVVYGIERQPFITRIAADVIDDDNPPDGQSDDGSWWAVEFYNPYDVALPLSDQRFEVQVTADPGAERIRLDSVLPGKRLVLLGYQGNAQPALTVGDARLQVHQSFRFENESVERQTIYLLFTAGNRSVAVDQFKVAGSNIAEPKPDGEEPYFIERKSNDDAQMTRWVTTQRWFAPIPVPAGTMPLQRTHPFGLEDRASDRALRPVQVLLANTGSLSSAYPTTGSLLLLMRYANHAIDQAGISPDKLAFTTQLADQRTDLENGRIPVFDVGMRHHYDPNVDPTLKPPARVPAPAPTNPPGGFIHLPWGQMIFDYFTTLPLQNKSLWTNPDGTADEEFWKNQQAAKPRVELNGLRVHGRIDLNAAPWSVLSGVPLVPMAEFEKGKDEGASDRPLIRAAIRKGVGLVRPNAPVANQLAPNNSDTNNPTQLMEDPPASSHVLTWNSRAATLSSEQAQAIVAYRELRSLELSSMYTSGDYNAGVATPTYGRGWIHATPTARRGTGFLTVGELANIRHPDASPAPLAGGQPIAGFNGYSHYRMDGGYVGSAQPDYLSAVSVLVALSDWVTVRSDVFTVYGSVWGELPPNSNNSAADAAALAARALRFQETVDRLPTFLGDQNPARIGERVVQKYSDLNAD